MKRLRRTPAFAVCAILALALAVPLLPLADPLHIDVAHRLEAPSAGHLLGQDEYGRDVLARLLWGARVSLAVALSAAALSFLIGVALGIVGGYLGRIAEFFAVRSMDAILCFPPLLLALLAVTLLGPGARALIPILAILYLPGFVRVTYAGVLGLRNQEYVEAMRALGAGPLRIMTRTILPNVLGPALVQFSLAAASAVLLESGLSFLGLGVVPPTPSWGLMIAAARSTVTQDPWLLFWPCLALSGTILALNALCDALRDLLDPHGLDAAFRGRGRLATLLPGLSPRMGPALEISGLTLEIGAPDGAVQPVRDVSLCVDAGETLAIVGESGSGKSLTGLAAMGLLPPAVRVVTGSAWLNGQELLRLDEARLRKLRGREFAMIFQNPLSSLNPLQRLGTQIVEALHAYPPQRRRDWRKLAIEALRRVGIPDPRRVAESFPHEISGGMRQRAMIAMAIINDPRLLIADEPTTALDVTIQAQILDLLAQLRRERRMALIFISHSLPVVSEIADRVAVMYAGEIVEQGPAGALLAKPLHPYTSALLRSAPREDGSLPTGIAGTVPPPYALPEGCVFGPRCALREEACDRQRPELAEVEPSRLTRCLRWREVA
jgi:peptide/nickel transport system permease protein